MYLFGKNTVNPDPWAGKNENASQHCSSYTPEEGAFYSPIWSLHPNPAVITVSKFVNMKALNNCYN